MKELYKERVAQPAEGYLYEVPSKVRNQIIMMLAREFDDIGSDYTKRFFEDVWWRLSERLGTTLPGLDDKNFMTGVMAAIGNRASTEVVLSAVELVCRRSQGYLDRPPGDPKSNKIIEQVNDYLRRGATGFAYEPTAGEIVRLESQHLHDEVIRPAFLLLQAKDLAGADEEFRKAHEHLRAGRTKEATNEALKTVESVMKTLCQRRNLDYSSVRGAKDLTKILIDNGVVSAQLDSYLSGLKAVLESGLPSLRNKRAGHGQGPEVVEMATHEAGFAVHLAGATVLFLVQAEESSR